MATLAPGSQAVNNSKRASAASGASGVSAVTGATSSNNSDHGAAEPPAKGGVVVGGSGGGGGGGGVTTRTTADSLDWGTPQGLPIRGANDENLNIFRQAVGINSLLAPTAKATGAGTLEQGRRDATGIYREVQAEQWRKGWQYYLINTLVYASHFFQIVIGAVLTALGPDAGSHAAVITALGAVNTVVAGVLALLQGQGLPDRMRRDKAEFTRLQDWIEETEALLAAGVIGRDRVEVGGLVELAFRKYNAAKASEENNVPDNYVPQRVHDTLDTEGIQRTTTVTDGTKPWDG